jgi:hypothetical protein
VRIYDRAELEALLAAAGCPVRAARSTERELNPQDWLNSPNVPPESQPELAQLIAEIERSGGAGLQVRHVDGQTRYVRNDLVLLGIKEPPA